MMLSQEYLDSLPTATTYDLLLGPFNGHANSGAAPTTNASASTIPLATARDGLTDAVIDTQPRFARYLCSRQRQARALGLFAVGLLVAIIFAITAPTTTRWLSVNVTGSTVELEAKISRTEEDLDNQGKNESEDTKKHNDDENEDTKKHNDDEDEDPKKRSDDEDKDPKKRSDDEDKDPKKHSDDEDEEGKELDQESGKDTEKKNHKRHVKEKFPFEEKKRSNDIDKIEKDKVENKDTDAGKAKEKDEDEGKDENKDEDEDEDDDEDKAEDKTEDKAEDKDEDKAEDQDEDKAEDKDEDNDEDDEDDNEGAAKGKKQIKSKGKNEKAENKDEKTRKGKKTKPKGECAATWAGCLNSECCKEAGMQCYKKDNYWAICKGNCTPGEDPDTHDVWSCKTVGERNWEIARPPLSRKEGYPSLYCFAFITPHELTLIKSQVAYGVGIFACDDFSVLAHRVIALGKLSDGGVWGKRKDPVKTTKVPTVKVTLAKDGTVLNVKLFMKVWHVIRKDGRFAKYDWTVKADPDTVLLPDRLRVHLKPQTFHKAMQYVKTCNVHPKSVSMLGALEILSGEAARGYTERWKVCQDKFKWTHLGENEFMEKCLDLLAASQIKMPTLMLDSNCLGVNCSDPWSAAFHHFKTIGSWMKCSTETIKSR